MERRSRDRVNSSGHGLEYREDLALFKARMCREQGTEFDECSIVHLRNTPYQFAQAVVLAQGAIDQICVCHGKFRQHLVFFRFEMTRKLGIEKGCCTRAESAPFYRVRCARYVQRKHQRGVMLARKRNERGISLHRCRPAADRCPEALR